MFSNLLKRIHNNSIKAFLIIRADGIIQRAKDNEKIILIKPATDLVGQHFRELRNGRIKHAIFEALSGQLGESNWNYKKKGASCVLETSYLKEESPARILVCIKCNSIAFLKSHRGSVVLVSRKQIRDPLIVEN